MNKNFWIKMYLSAVIELCITAALFCLLANYFILVGIVIIIGIIQVIWAWRDRETR